MRCFVLLCEFMDKDSVYVDSVWLHREDVIKHISDLESSTAYKDVFFSIVEKELYE